MDNEATVRAIVEANTYMTLGTADEHGRPWASPVFYASADCVDFYWVSAPDTRHSRNLAVRPELSIVIFNSQSRPYEGLTQAVYLEGEAAQVTGEDVDRGLEIYPGPPSRGARPISAADLRPPGPYRLYRARATAHWIICPRPPGQPCTDHGKNFDHRTEVRLAPAS